jgi:hypothetical protein
MKEDEVAWACSMDRSGENTDIFMIGELESKRML